MAHFQHAKLSAKHINSVFNPEDKQDIKLAVDLLRDIWNLLKGIPEAPNPGFSAAWITIWTFRQFLVWTSRSLSSRSTSAWQLMLVIFCTEGIKFMSNQLYMDIMTTIKNVYICIAKFMIDHLNSTFYIILLGTDRLEILFGNICTIVGNNANTDMLQLDHLSPQHWVGDVDISNVLLQTSWCQGHALAKEIYEPAAANLQDTEHSNPGINVLTLKGVLLVGVPESSDSEPDNVDKPARKVQPSELASLDANILVDIEDQLGEELDFAEADVAVGTAQGPPIHLFEQTTVFDGTRMLKS
ncbi:hypothetical protein FA15DRAFT_707712 [Coprinopsis marcescibilis]|uniref:Uncharacterized protein n=1 Tax=Coprinopsis marcescibilis TaxID=230819 RepID=A0A5C3KKX8_COPMA|nr:hypothetical protein FA15DRAFT_707712 [Coprinopsis marcescibilis]